MGGSLTYLFWGQEAGLGVFPQLNRMTDTCENVTFPPITYVLKKSICFFLATVKSAEGLSRMVLLNFFENLFDGKSFKLNYIERIILNTCILKRNIT